MKKKNSGLISNTFVLFLKGRPLLKTYFVIFNSSEKSNYELPLRSEAASDIIAASEAAIRAGLRVLMRLL